LNTHKPEAQARRAETQRRQNAALRTWDPAAHPAWLDEAAYREKIQPCLASVSVPKMMAALEISEPYALQIRAARRIPHRRHWLALATLIGGLAK